MWQEISKEDIDKLENIAIVSNSRFACFQDIGIQDSIDLLSKQLETSKYEYRGFLYQDTHFLAYLDFRKWESSKDWEIMRCWLLWDENNPSIDPMVGSRIIAEKNRDFMKEMNVNTYLHPFSYETAPETMRKWYNPQIGQIYNELGVKLTYELDGIMCNLYFELM